MTFRYDKYERGGLLFISDNQIVGYYLDEASRRRLSYCPSEELLSVLYEAIDKRYEFAFIHSHPGRDGNSILSNGDVYFATEFLRLNPCFKSVYMALLSGDVLKIYLIGEDTDMMPHLLGMMKD